MQDLKEILTREVNKTLMVVFPHPDDESWATGGLLLLAKSLGWKTVVLTLTKGGAGKIHVHGNGRSLKEIREDELIKATKILQVSKLILRDFPDSKLRFTILDWEKVVAKEIDKHRPSIVVTYGPNGTTGHPDHIILSRVLLKLAIKKKFTLLWSTLEENLARRFLEERLLKTLSKPTHRLDIWPVIWAKYRAITAHRSQRGFALPFYLITIYFFWYHAEHYTWVNPSQKYEFKFTKFKI